jgi:hypothetical protein
MILSLFRLFSVLLCVNASDRRTYEVKYNCVQSIDAADRFLSKTGYVASWSVIRKTSLRKQLYAKINNLKWFYEKTKIFQSENLNFYQLRLLSANLFRKH